MADQPVHAQKAKYDPSSTLPRKRTLCDPSVCSLYFLAGAGLIKIGISTNLTSRIRSIRNSSPVPLELLATMPGGTALEGVTHSWFQHLRRHGEWFDDNGEIRAKIIQFTREPNREVRIPEDSPLSTTERSRARG